MRLAGSALAATVSCYTRLLPLLFSLCPRVELLSFDRCQEQYCRLIDWKHATATAATALSLQRSYYEYCIAAIPAVDA